MSKCKGYRYWNIMLSSLKNFISRNCLLLEQDQIIVFEKIKRNASLGVCLGEKEDGVH